MSKLPEIGKRYKNKHNGKTYSAVTYLGSHPEISCRLCCENDLMSDLNYRPTNNNFDKDFEELPDQEPIEEHVKNLYTKEEHVKKSGKSLHEESIWKPISELPEVYCAYSILFKIGGEVHNGHIYRNGSESPVVRSDNQDVELDIVDSFCSLTDFIKHQESLEQRITDLEKRLIT